MLKTITRTLAAAGVAALLAGAAQAQTAPRVYENGSVWRISHIETKPGMFDEYLAYLKGQWRASNEAGIKAGAILSYKVLQVDSARDGEPDLILAIEFKNMAVFDSTQAEQDQRTAALWGSNQKAAQALISRETMRVQRGGVLVRELKFTN